MGQKKRLFARREERRKLKISRTARSVVGNFAYVFLAGAIVFFVVVVLVATRHTPVSTDRKSTRLNSSHYSRSRMPSSA